jgi:uncharacterized DUF497 family protein
MKKVSDVNFDWNENKNQTNIIKHGIDCRAAAKIFKDDNFIASEDNSSDYGEVHYKIIGNVEPHGILLVVFTEREGDIIRIISARKATKKERLLYQKNH